METLIFLKEFNLLIKSIYLVEELTPSQKKLIIKYLNKLEIAEGRLKKKEIVELLYKIKSKLINNFENKLNLEEANLIEQNKFDLKKEKLSLKCKDENKEIEFRLPKNVIVETEIKKIEIGGHLNVIKNKKFVNKKTNKVLGNFHVIVKDRANTEKILDSEELKERAISLKDEVLTKSKYISFKKEKLIKEKLTNKNILFLFKELYKYKTIIKFKKKYKNNNWILNSFKGD